MLRSRSRYEDLGEKPSKYFFNLESRNYTNKVMNKIIDENGLEFTETKDILKCQQEFHEKLYDDTNLVNDVPIDDDIGNDPQKLPDELNSELEGEIRYSELGNALKTMKNNKKSGLDGYTVEFFKFFCVDLGYFIMRSLNYGYRIGSLCITQKQSVITCLPKPNKSRFSLKNWRPISLLNVIYKIASSVIANRLKQFYFI